MPCLEGSGFWWGFWVSGSLGAAGCASYCLMDSFTVAFAEVPNRQRTLTSLVVCDSTCEVLSHVNPCAICLDNELDVTAVCPRIRTADVEEGLDQHHQLNRAQSVQGAQPTHGVLESSWLLSAFPYRGDPASLWAWCRCWAVSTPTVGLNLLRVPLCCSKFWTKRSSH
jgi:hypothetical protein